MTGTVTAADVAALAELARLEAERHPAASSARRAAAHLWVSATVPAARSLAAVRRAVQSFGDEATQGAALDLLAKITTTRETT